MMVLTRDVLDPRQSILTEALLSQSLFKKSTKVVSYESYHEYISNIFKPSNYLKTEALKHLDLKTKAGINFPDWLGGNTYTIQHEFVELPVKRSRDLGLKYFIPEVIVFTIPAKSIVIDNQKLYDSLSDDSNLLLSRQKFLNDFITDKFLIRVTPIKDQPGMFERIERTTNRITFNIGSLYRHEFNDSIFYLTIRIYSDYTIAMPKSIDK